MIEIQDEMKLMQEKFEDMEVKSFGREVIEFIDLIGTFCIVNDKITTFIFIIFSFNRNILYCKFTFGSFDWGLFPI